jgi:hypothetical protein
VSDEYVEAAGPIFKAGDVFDKDIAATEHNTDIGTYSGLKSVNFVNLGSIVIWGDT